MKRWPRAWAALALASLSPAGVAVVAAAAPGGAPGAEIVFCRRVDPETGRRVGVADQFAIARKRDVLACVDLTGLAAGRPYAVHLVWIDTVGAELFRKYAVVTPRREGAAWVGDVSWRRATELTWCERETLRSVEPRLTLETKLGIAPEKQRALGQYALRVYLDRRLVAESAFALRPEEPPEPKEAKPAVEPKRKSADGRKSGRKAKR